MTGGTESVFFYFLVGHTSIVVACLESREDVEVCALSVLALNVIDSTVGSVTQNCML